MLHLPRYCRNSWAGVGLGEMGYQVETGRKGRKKKERGQQRKVHIKGTERKKTAPKNEGC